MRTGDIAVNSALGATEAADVFFSHVNARAIEAVCRLMIDSLDLGLLMRVIPFCRSVGIDNRSVRARSATE